MRGEFIGVWSETRREIWQPLLDELLLETDAGVPDDIFCDLYRELVTALKVPPSAQDLADIIDNPLQSRETFEKVGAEDIAGERALVGFFESAYDALEELGDDQLSNRYFNLLAAFIEKFRLLKPSCMACPSVPSPRKTGYLKIGYFSDMRGMACWSVAYSPFDLRTVMA